MEPRKPKPMNGALRESLQREKEFGRQLGSFSALFGRLQDCLKLTKS